MNPADVDVQSAIYYQDVSMSYVTEKKPTALAVRRQVDGKCLLSLCAS